MVFNYLLAAFTAVFVSVGSLGKKDSNARTMREKFLNIAAFSAIVAVAMWGGYIIEGGAISATVVLYALLFGGNFVLCNYTLYAAMECGGLSETNLFNSLSLVIPSLAGILFWQEPYQLWAIVVGMALIIFSLIMILLGGKRGKQEQCRDKTTRIKWICFSLVAFITNGLSSIIQKSEQTVVGGAGVIAMTALSFTFVGVMAGLIYIMVLLIQKEPCRADMIALWKNKKSVLFNAVGIGAVNLAVTYLSTRLAGAFLYPCVLGGAVVITAILSVIIYKERPTVSSALGILAGIAAIVIFSL